MKTWLVLLVTTLLYQSEPTDYAKQIIGRWQNVESPQFVHQYTAETRQEFIDGDALNPVPYKLQGDTLLINTGKYEHRFKVSFPRENTLLRLVYLNPPKGQNGPTELAFKRVGM
jgi:hypothetical protein